MADANLNQLWARALVDELCAAGVSAAVVCPGSRSGPIALAFADRPGLKTWSVIDERSAGFFALGIAKERGAPVAVLATSGTAGANFFPAVIEAAMAQVPLLVMTADRPIELHGWGALQTIPQQHFYGQFARWSVDLGVPEATPAAVRHLRATASRAAATAQGSPRGPVHMNAPFREPLAPTPEVDSSQLERLTAAAEGMPPKRFVPALQEPRPDALDALRRKLEVTPRGLIVCGPRDFDEGLRGAVLTLGRALAYPVLAEATSQVRFGEGGSEVISHYDLLLRHAPFSSAHRPQIVLRFGGPLISKELQAWLDLSGAEIVVFPDGGALVDPSHSAHFFVEGAPVAACDRLSIARAKKDSAWIRSFESAERRARAALEDAFASDAGLPEPRTCREVVAAIPSGGNLFVSSSMPVRDVDAFVSGSPTPIRVLANRGVNGIDGTTSTALGIAASSGRPTVLLTGDLAFLHDLSGLLTARKHKLSMTIVVLNNDGGGIFSFLPIAQFPAHFNELFATPHGLDFSKAAALFGAHYHSPANARELTDELRTSIEGGLHLVEVRTDRQANPLHHRALYERVDAALGTGGAR